MELIKTEVVDRSAYDKPNIVIKVYEHIPDIPKPITDKEWEDHFDNYANGDFVQGKYSYEVYRQGELEPFFSDSHDIWDIENALNLAYQDFGDKWECA